LSFDHDRFGAALRSHEGRPATKAARSKRQVVCLVARREVGTRQPHREAHDGRTYDSIPPEPLERFVRSNGRIFFLKTEEIDWIAAADDYLSLHYGDKAYLVRETMANLYDKLDQRKFLRVHRSTIVNVERIRDVRPLS
jgi:DNA-binding LytR/AlgR family response regulator